MEHTVKYIKYGNKIDDTVFEFDDKHQLLASFLSSDVTHFANWIKDDFDEVISGQTNYKEINGNICGLEIRPDTTKVYDNLAEDGMGNWCEVDTRELRELVDEWCEHIEEFNKKIKGNL